MSVVERSKQYKEWAPKQKSYFYDGVRAILQSETSPYKDLKKKDYTSALAGLQQKAGAIPHGFDDEAAEEARHVIKVAIKVRALSSQCCLATHLLQNFDVSFAELKTWFGMESRLTRPPGSEVGVDDIDQVWRLIQVYFGEL